MLAILFANLFAPLMDYSVVKANIARRRLRGVLWGIHQQNLAGRILPVCSVLRSWYPVPPWCSSPARTKTGYWIATRIFSLLPDCMIRRCTLMLTWKTCLPSSPARHDLISGEFLSDGEAAELGIDPATYDQRTVINNPELSEAIAPEQDVADIKRRVVYPLVYLQEQGGQLSTVVLPVNGYGLWGIMYGYLALESDGNTVKGISFYELKETPGLGCRGAQSPLAGAVAG